MNLAVVLQAVLLIFIIINLIIILVSKKEEEEFFYEVQKRFDEVYRHIDFLYGIQNDLERLLLVHVKNKEVHAKDVSDRD